MKVFISWSGETSRQIAVLLRTYIPIMLQDVDAFMSQHDIETGTRWAQRIQEELEQTSYGLIVLTPENVDARWLLFEAGAISKVKNSIVSCLLCAGLTDTDVRWPLAQFQLQKLERANFWQLIRDMNRHLSKPLLDESVKMVFEKWWGDIEAKIVEIQSNHATLVPTPAKDEKEFQEEIFRMLRGALEKPNVREMNLSREPQDKVDDLERAKLREAREYLSRLPHHIIDVIGECMRDRNNFKKLSIVAPEALSELSDLGLITQVGDRTVIHRALISAYVQLFPEGGV